MPVRPTRDEQSLIFSETVVLRCLGQRQLDKVRLSRSRCPLVARPALLRHIGPQASSKKWPGLPKPLPLGATATTAASGGNREELLGPRPAGCERQRSRRWEPQPGQWHAAGVTERASQLRQSRCEAIGRLFCQSDTIAVFLFCLSVLALSGAPRQLSQRESLRRRKASSL